MAGGLLVAALVIVFTVGAPVAPVKPKFESASEEIDFRSVVSSLGDAVLVYDRDFKVLFFNPAAEKLFRLTQSVVLGHVVEPRDAEDPSWRLLVQVVFPSLAPTVILRSQPDEHPQVADLSFTDPPLDIRVTTSVVKNDLGETTGFIKLVHDRTREVFLVRSKTEFLTVASHQLRSPTTDISWALESLAGEKGLSETGQAIVQSALAASRELLKVIEDLLNVSKIEEGHFGYKFEPKDIVAFLDEILPQVAASARRAGIKIYFDRSQEPLPPVMIDPQKLSMALNNILVNAIRYNVENGEVVVKTERVSQRPFIEVSVRDTGIGIPPEALDKLFQKFFRAENATKSQPEGSGLGLYIAKNVVQAHGGKIWAESESGRGSVLHFTLPTDPSLIPAHEIATEE